MKNFVILLIFIFIFTFAFVLPSTAAVVLEKTPVKLERDPFDHPDLVNPPKLEVEVETPEKEEEEKAVDLELRATLVGKYTSIANINGILLSPGDLIEDYRLLQVREGEAVFKRNGKKVIIYMKNAYSQ